MIHEKDARRELDPIVVKASVGGIDSVMKVKLPDFGSCREYWYTITVVANDEAPGSGDITFGDFVTLNNQNCYPSLASGFKDIGNAEIDIKAIGPNFQKCYSFFGQSQEGHMGIRSSLDEAVTVFIKVSPRDIIAR